MFVIAATFDEELALSRIRDVLAMADTPETLAERLGMTRDLEVVRQAVITPSFKRLTTELKNRRQYLDIGKQIEEAKGGGGGVTRLFGSGFQEKKIAKLEAERKKIPTIHEAQRWFYSHPRVLLLFAVRDYALDGSLHPDAAWRETDAASLPFPIVRMFETGDLDFAKDLAAELEKPLKQADAKFILTKFEGQRSIGFDCETQIATYYAPAPADPQ